MQSSHYTAIARAADEFGADVLAADYAQGYGSTRTIALVHHQGDQDFFQVMYFVLSLPRHTEDVHAMNTGGNPVTCDRMAAFAEFARETS